MNCFFHSPFTIDYSLFLNLAGAAGIEPAVTVLETVGLPLTDAPKFYLTSLWVICFRQKRQYFFNSNLPCLSFLFFVEVYNLL